MNINATEKEVSEFFGISASRVRQLSADGVFEKIKRKYHLRDCTRAYITQLKNSYSTRGPSTFDTEKLRKLKEEADKLERERLRDEGRMIDAEEVYQTLEKVFVSIRQKILAEVHLSAETKAEILNNLKASMPK